MRISNRPASYRDRETRKRALACSLLACIFYAITFGSAHSHVNPSVELNSVTASNAAGQAAPSFTGTLRSYSNGYGCLVCVLHQQLFNTAVDEAPRIAKPTLEIAFDSIPAIFYHSNPIASEPVTRMAGRAPPAA